MCRGTGCGRVSRDEGQDSRGRVHCMCYARYYMGPARKDDRNLGYSRGDFSSLPDYARSMMSYHETKTGC